MASITLTNPNFIKKEINSVGDTVTITAITKTFGADEYRIETDVEVDTTSVKCLVNILSEGDESVKQGEARSGDMIFWFDSDRASLLVRGNKITWDSKTFQITDVRNFRIRDEVQIIEVRTAQI